MKPIIGYNKENWTAKLEGLKGKVNHLYFAVLVLKENRQNLEIHLENLQARYKAVQTAVTHGSLLETESNADF